jgi:hypothetical protein
VRVVNELEREPHLAVLARVLSEGVIENPVHRVHGDGAVRRVRASVDGVEGAAAAHGQQLGVGVRVKHPLVIQAFVEQHGSAWCCVVLNGVLVAQILNTLCVLV